MLWPRLGNKQCLWLHHCIPCACAGERAGASGGKRAGGPGRPGGWAAPDSGVAGAIGSRDSLTEVIRRGAADLLAAAVEAEVAAWIDEHAHITDDHGRRQVEYMPSRAKPPPLKSLTMSSIFDSGTKYRGAGLPSGPSQLTK